ncbi:MAG: KamA family radical SAM protein, partial [Leptospiraceae bacterium]|nr:KamA family radical SAM protein [Leptospiraceae bacterium]
LTSEEKEIFYKAESVFDFGVTPYYISLVDKNNLNCPIRKQIIPQVHELTFAPHERKDPLAEETYMPVRGVTHRYPDRALWYLSHTCAVYCRFCTRKRKVGKSQNTPRKEDWRLALDYFQKHTEIKEVILSGGDPLSLSDSSISYLLSELRKIPHINHIRIHSRHPVTLPFRIKSKLCKIFQENFPIFFVTHFNHPREITPESREAVRKLIQEGNVIVLNQGVLLKGINDSADVLKELFYKLIGVGVKPYYLHQCDEVFGSSGFKVPIQKGIQIMKELRGFISGVCLPTYVVDLSGGGGKVPLPTDYVIKENAEDVIFENFQGEIFKVMK